MHVCVPGRLWRARFELVLVLVTLLPVFLISSGPLALPLLFPPLPILVPLALPLPLSLPPFPFTLALTLPFALPLPGVPLSFPFTLL